MSSRRGRSWTRRGLRTSISVERRKEQTRRAKVETVSFAFSCSKSTRMQTHKKPQPCTCTAFHLVVDSKGQLPRSNATKKGKKERGIETVELTTRELIPSPKQLRTSKRNDSLLRSVSLSTHPSNPIQTLSAHPLPSSFQLNRNASSRRDSNSPSSSNSSPIQFDHLYPPNKVSLLHLHLSLTHPLFGSLGTHKRKYKY